MKANSGVYAINEAVRKVDGQHHFSLRAITTMSSVLNANKKIYEAPTGFISDFLRCAQDCDKVNS